MRHAVGLKAYSSQQPLDEFRLEANRAFLLLLDTYRDAVVARLMVPDLNFSLLMGGQQDDEDLLFADMQQAQQQQQPAAGGGNGHHVPPEQQQHPQTGVANGSANGSNSQAPAEQQDPPTELQPAATNAGTPRS